MNEVPDSMDPMDEMPQTLEGMLDEQITLQRKLLGLSDRLLNMTRVGKPDPVVHAIIKLSEVSALQTATQAKICEEIRELKEKGSY